MKVSGLYDATLRLRSIIVLKKSSNYERPSLSSGLPADPLRDNGYIEFSTF
jgi:hypothetical protein